MSVDSAAAVQTGAAASSKYGAVASALTEQIRSGTYQPGDLLPSEPALSRHFGVSRHTVRSALRHLYEKGLIVSQRGRGSVVQANAIDPRYKHACDTVEDILQYAAETPRRVLHRRRVNVDAALAEQLGCPAGYPWWEVHTVRHLGVDGPVVASSRIWVPDEFSAAVTELGSTDEPLFVVMERRCGCHFAEIAQTLSIAQADAQEAEDLQVGIGAAVMCVERRFVDGRGGLLEVSRSVHPAASFRYEMRLRRVIGA